MTTGVPGDRPAHCTSAQRPESRFTKGSATAADGAVTVTDFDVVVGAPLSSVTVSVTVYVPAVPYVRDGFVSEELAPSPKVQLRDAMLPSASLLPPVTARVTAVRV